MSTASVSSRQPSDCGCDLSWAPALAEQHSAALLQTPMSKDSHLIADDYPSNFLKKQGLQRGRYNQIANFVLAQSEISIAIGDDPPKVYFAELAKHCTGGKKKYGGITEPKEMRENIRMNCLSESLLDGEMPAYDDFLE